MPTPAQELEAYRDALESALTAFFSGLPYSPTSAQITAYVNTLGLSDFRRGKSISGLLHLPGGVQWVDRWQYQPRKKTLDMTVGGGMVVWETDNVIGQNITLESPDGGGWWSEEALVILNSMAAQQGVIYVLMWENTQTRCIFNNSDGPATELSKLNPWSGYHVGTLRLVTA